MFEVDVNNVMEQEKKKKDKDHLWFRVLMCKTKNNSEEQFQDEGSYERQNTRDTKFATKKTGVPLLGFTQSFNKLFSSSSEGFPDHTHNQ